MGNIVLRLIKINPNQIGMPADSKGVAGWYFNTNWCYQLPNASQILEIAAYCIPTYVITNLPISNVS